MDTKNTNVKDMDIKNTNEENPNMRNANILVLSGGGFKGIPMLGALQHLYTTNQLSTVKYYVGTSVGSMICYLLIIGYTPIEIFLYICEHDITPEWNSDIFNMCVPVFTSIVQNNNKIESLKILLAYVLKHGIVKYEKIHNILEQMTLVKLPFIPRMKDLIYLFNKTLICTTYRYAIEGQDKDCIHYITPINYPELSCLDAIRMSSNIPAIFGEYTYNNYKYIDGGFVSNFSISDIFTIDVFVALNGLANCKTTLDLQTCLRNNKYNPKIFTPSILGITVLGNNYIKSSNVLLSIIGIAYLPIYVREKNKIEESKYARVIKLSVDEIGPNATNGEKVKSFNMGKKQVMRDTDKVKKD